MRSCMQWGILTRAAFGSLLAADGMLGSNLVAQNEPRASGRFHRNYSSAGENGWLGAAERSGVVSLTWSVDRAGDIPVSIPLPCNRPGNAVHLASRMFVVCGADVQGDPPRVTGHLHLVQLLDNPARIVVQQSEVMPDVEWTEVTFDARDQRLWVFDRRHGGLWTAAMGSSWALPTAAALQQVATPLQGSTLATIGWWLLPDAAAPGVTLVQRSSMVEEMLGYRIHQIGGVWTASLMLEATGSPTWYFQQSNPDARATTIAIGGGTGPFEVVDEAGSVLVTGNAATTAVMSWPVASLAVPGTLYRIRSVGNTGVVDSPLQMFHSRWGTGRTSATLTVVPDAAADLQVGNDDFTVRTRLSWRDPTRTDEVTRDAWLAVGYTLPGADNVIWSGEDALMASASAVLGPYRITVRGVNDGHLTVPLPVRSDAGAAGLHVVFQWLVADGAEWVTSPVFGAVLQPPRTAATGPATKPTLAQLKAKAQTFEAWLPSLPQSAWTQPKRDVLRQAGAGFIRR